MVSAKLGLIRKLQIEKNVFYNKVNIKNEELLNIKQEFIDAMSNDFNTANAITTIIKTVKLINNLIRQKEIDENFALELLTLLDEEMWVLGIDTIVEPLNDDDLALVQKWQNARNEKNFELADKLRKEIQDKGIKL